MGDKSDKITIGMLREKYGAAKKTAEACSFVAYKENVDFFYFSIDKVDFDKKIINGEIYDDGKWLKKEFSYPDIVYNDRGKVNKDLYKRLEKDIIFTAQPVGNKTYVHNLLMRDAKAKDYLIPTESFEDFKQINEYLKKYNKVVLKPISSNQGKGIIFIERNDDSFMVNYDRKTFHTDKQQLNQFIDETIQVKYLIQPYIESRTQAGLPFDLRAHLQKNGKGKWVVTSIYTRIGANDGIVSNGGYIALLHKFLKKEFGLERYKIIRRKVKKFSLQFVEYYQDLYKHPFDEIGLDLALDRDENIYIFEVNAKPDHQGGFLSFKAAQSIIPYAKYLVENYHPKILEIPKNKHNDLTIFFGGNIFLGSSESNKYNYHFKELEHLYSSADVKTFNLNAPICQKAERLDDGDKTKYKMSPNIIKKFEREKFDIFYLANNHMTDYQHDGLLETTKLLSNANMISIGADKNEMSARKGVHVTKGNESVGLLNYMSYHKSYDDEYKHFSYHEKSGVSPLLEKNVYQDIAYMRRQGVKTIIVSVHWGRNYKEITDKQRQEADLIIDAGADVIIGHGTHDYQPMEIKKGIPVFYSLGDFICTVPNRTGFKYGYPVNLSFINSKLTKAEVYPTITNTKDINYRQKHLKKKEARKALEEFFESSQMMNIPYEIKKDRAIIYLE